MIETLQHWLGWVNAHPHVAMLMLFVAALLDALFVLGAFVPAGIVLFAGGAVVALGSLSLWQAVALAAAGAVAGDGFSYWLGRRYGDRLLGGAWLRKHPETLSRAQGFFARYGAYSIAMARFLGPVRAFVPALAGASGLRTLPFLTAAIPAATLWALTFIFPGVVFGASLGLAAEVGGKLALLLLALLLVIVVAFILARLMAHFFQNHAAAWVGAMLDWSRHHRGVGNFGTVLADPDQPETPALLVLAVLLLALSASGVWLASGAFLHAHPLAADAAFWQAMRDLHTPWGLALAAYAERLGHWKVYVPLALVVLAGLLWARRIRAAAHWLAALGFGGLLSLGLYATPVLAPPARYFGALTPLAPDAIDLLLAPVVYAFLATLMAIGRRPRVRVAIYGATTAIVLLIALARLYLGMQWLSTAAIVTVTGVAWAVLLGLGYRRHMSDARPLPRIILPALLIFLAGFSAALTDARAPAATAASPDRTLAEATWREDGWQMLPRQRLDIAGRGRQSFNLQWAGTPDELKAILLAAGWREPPPLSAGDVLRYLAPDSAITELPVLPQVHAGHNPALSLRLSTDRADEYLLRLWPSGFRLDDGRPLWVGTLSRLKLTPLYALLTYPAPQNADVDTEAVLSAAPALRIEARGALHLLSSSFPTRSNPTQKTVDHG